MDVTIRKAEQSDFKAAHDILHICFSTDPAFSWLSEDPTELFNIIGKFFETYMKLAIKKGTVLLAEIPGKGAVGVTLWKPHDAEDPEADMELMEFAGDKAPRLQIQADAVLASYPPMEPYEVMMAAAVHPSMQGRGIGDLLISHRLKELDNINMPTYLEATTRRAAGGIYERFGFQPVGEPMRFPHGIEVYPMWRNPCEPITDANAQNGLSHIGSLIDFGQHKWRILDVKNDLALIVSEFVLEKHNYHKDFELSSWADCTLRSYLNEEFYNTFNDVEQFLIAETYVSACDNPWFLTSGGKNIKDKIFLLSTKEVVKYFGDSNQLRNKNPRTKYFIDDQFNNTRKTTDINGVPCPWWLRTPGNTQYFATTVTTDGRITMSGDFVNRDNTIGIRPAMWIKR